MVKEHDQMQKQLKSIKMINNFKHSIVAYFKNFIEKNLSNYVMKKIYYYSIIQIILNIKQIIIYKEKKQTFINFTKYILKDTDKNKKIKKDILRKNILDLIISTSTYKKISINKLQTINTKIKYILNFLQLYFFKKTRIITINNKSKNLFINIKQILGKTILKSSAGLYINTKHRKGKKKLMTYIYKQLFNNIINNHKIKNQLNIRYIIHIKSTKNEQLIKPFAKKIDIKNIMYVITKPLGNGCKIKRNKRKKKRNIKK